MVGFGTSKERPQNVADTNGDNYLPVPYDFYNSCFEELYLLNLCKLMKSLKLIVIVSVNHFAFIDRIQEL